jgi:hypothetical protein
VSPTTSKLFHLQYCSRDKTTRFTYVASLRLEEKRKHILREAKILQKKEMRQRATNYCSWEIMFIVRMYMLVYLLPLQPL